MPREMLEMSDSDNASLTQEETLPVETVLAPAEPEKFDHLLDSY